MYGLTLHFPIRANLRDLTGGAADDGNCAPACQATAKALEGLRTARTPGAASAVLEELHRFADLGNEHAHWALAVLALECFGDAGCLPSVERHVRHLRLAAARGHSEAQAKLAQLYLQGEVVPRDVRRAKKLLLQAGQAGSTLAVKLLAQASVPEATLLQHLERAATRGNTEALLQLALRLLAAPSGKDVARGVSLLKQAAARRNPVAAQRLGDLYRQPRGGPVRYDIVQAAGYLYKAATWWREEVTGLLCRQEEDELRLLEVTAVYDAAHRQQFIMQHAVIAWHCLASEQRRALSSLRREVDQRLCRRALVKWFLNVMRCRAQLSLNRHLPRVAALTLRVVAAWGSWAAVMRKSAAGNMRIIIAQMGKSLCDRVFRSWARYLQYSPTSHQSCHALASAFDCWRKSVRSQTGARRLLRALSRTCVAAQGAALRRWISQASASWQSTAAAQLRLLREETAAQEEAMERFRQRCELELQQWRRMVEKERAANAALESLSRNEEERAWLQSMDQKNIAQVSMQRSSRSAALAANFTDHQSALKSSSVLGASARGRAEERPRHVSSMHGPSLDLTPPSLGHRSRTSHNYYGSDQDTGRSSAGSLASSPGWQLPTNSQWLTSPCIGSSTGTAASTPSPFVRSSTATAASTPAPKHQAELMWTPPDARRLTPESSRGQDRRARSIGI